MSSASSSSSQESLGFPQPPRYRSRRVLVSLIKPLKFELMTEQLSLFVCLQRAVESVDELDALGFAGIPRRHASGASSSTVSLSQPPPHSFDVPPPPYCRFEHRSGFAGVSWSFDDLAVSDDVIVSILISRFNQVVTMLTKYLLSSYFIPIYGHIYTQIGNVNVLSDGLAWRRDHGQVAIQIAQGQNGKKC